MERAHYSVSGLVNETTRTHIKNALEKVDGVSKVCVDLGRSTVEVMYNEPASEADIENCIADTGFNINI